MIPEEVLQIVLSRLDRYEIQHMVTGSFASNMHGVPRTTYDADVVIDASRDSLDRFVQNLGDEFYVNPETAAEAWINRRMFNVIHLESGFKVDLILKKARPFSQEEFSRRKKINVLGQSLWFATAEDVILAKLEWYKQGESEKQFVDALNIAKVQGEALELPYLKQWAKELGVHELLEKLHNLLA